MIVRMRMLPQESLSISLTIYHRLTFDIWIRSSHKVSHIMQIAGEAECGVVWWGREWQLCMRTSGHWPWCHRPQHQPRPANTTRDAVNLWHVRWVHVTWEEWWIVYILLLLCWWHVDLSLWISNCEWSPSTNQIICDGLWSLIMLRNSEERIEKTAQT